jgi:hypothetical protein
MAAWLGVGIVWWIGLAMAGVAAVTIGVLVSADRPALRFVEAAGARPLIADAEGLSLPVECLAGGIAQHAVGRAESVVRVPWETITAWEIFEHQHVLQVRPDPARYGIFPRFAIPRRGSILAAEHALLAVARAHLRVPIEVRHGG